MPAPAPTAFHRGQRRTLLVFALLLASFLLYAPSLGSDFVWDDRDAATAFGTARNPLVAELRPLADYLTGNWWPQRNPSAETYRPLTTWLFALRHALCGDHAMVAHLLSVLLHTLGIGLVFRLLRELGAGFAAAWLGAAVFGAHALHGEAVLTIVGQAELLALVFGLLGTLAALRALRSTRPAPWWGATTLAFTAACFSKESAVGWTVIAPLCVFAAQRTHRRTTSRAGWLGLGAAVALPATLFLLLRARMLATLPRDELGYAFLDNPLAHVDTFARVASGLVAWGHGLLLTLAPFRLAIEYGPGQLPIVTRADEPWCLAAAAASIAVAAFTWQALQIRRAPLRALAAALFVTFTLPISNVFALVFMRFAERAYVTPTLAAALFAAWALQRARTPIARRTTWAIAGAWLLLSAGLSCQRIFVWRDDRTIIEHGVTESPGSLRMQLCAGALANRDGDAVRARHHFERAAAIDPASPQAWCELANLDLRAGNRDGAAQALAKANAGRPREAARHRAEIDATAARLASAAPR